ncbi:MAG: multifunctional oxoglutarate decarboxylase/oxoglutarate dehydrogenase thiamine pyrophosphate-binding subunit/dihydrolipoyllysine-residue succinyltransferase subunit [candidate division KSB1 bacterium]|nr:multifunctional oxoglutarate decarboxylase/oxoglutarate dehydrogenase thiamine pyrophosphate-binding subunit/dihydrolipoyllysine-residue succinyltransferase subunit [candidate division KSB1 bacterium]MDZ7369462.1 multifunctional oxoglutarate decarboxylase/oxoglutarate dehydrogenase thiamine pyrophosphate-binding subunit/dihydrolipoyllysine-residue succinyltransferase subunit [candidate division KSB1 bacterium]MDZ7407571.1 multifunctional oxoglutarate decarboxylase/oxoglutarate dehydrogenase th
MPDTLAKQYPEAFGPNAWLIEEMYRQFREQPETVTESWRDFFEDYRPLSAPAPQVGAEPSAPKPAEPPEDGRATIPPGATPLRGGVARIVENMQRSLGIPTATSVRIIPVKLLEENRRIINQYLADATGGKMSFTHIIAWAIVKALKVMPVMATSFFESNGTAYKVTPEYLNLGLAVDVAKKDGSRTLFVPNIKAADTMDFSTFFAAYNEILRKVYANQVTPEDFAGTTVTLTNPGTIGTVHSVPRLMPGQGLIVATGAIDYPPEYQAADPRTIARLGISKVMTVTSTYDHRVIQGAESGLFLQALHKLLTGEDDFYEEIFASMKIPHQPVRLTRDINPLLEAGEAMIEKQARVLQLINIYRVRGHLIANLNPLSTKAPSHKELDPERYGLTVWDYDREFITGGLGGRQRATLREILDTLREAYCQTIGVEYMHIQEPEQKEWIQQRIEGVPRKKWMESAAKRRILTKLNEAEAFERFLHAKYVGHKRFSLEGAESLIPMLDALLLHASKHDIVEVVMGMAHRGRINVLANILGKSYQEIFLKFEDNPDPNSREGTGDVKYHLGATGAYQSPDGKSVAITLAPNPSHLEAVDPVVEGMVRAKQDILGDAEHRRVLALLIHGDAAFAGQGVVAETLNLSALHGYRTGGTVHIVINNGIGFTTAPVDARSSVYATDVAKMVQAPIFHVNGNDPEACVRVIELALAFRQAFQKDVVIDMICFRRHGHNESDEPSYTQPLMYSRIKDMRSVRKHYTETLIKRGELSLEEAEQVLKEFQARLEEAFKTTQKSITPTEKLPSEPPLDEVLPFIPTGVPRQVLDAISFALANFPRDFHVHPKLAKQLVARGTMLDEDAVDWGTAESLAFGSLLLEGIPIRLSGQDSQRGTFSQRHAVLVDYENEKEFTPLNHIREGQAALMIYDSLLSEYAVLGFDYGYSVARKEALTLWEAQFGDFMNGAQIIIDQFISSAEEKWGQASGLVMLLPHGFEGQGPEHSSGRIERFLTLCAEENMRVTVPTTAAQYFHLLRNQMHAGIRKPLIVMTPKSLLRSPAAKSAAAEFVEGGFQILLDDPAPPQNPTRLLLCSGKVFYDLMSYRQQNNVNDTVIIRLEQLYPFPFDGLKEILQRYPKLMDWRWVQEEPRNMGAWNFVQTRLKYVLTPNHRLTYVGRVPSASPATGSARVHQLEQERLIRQAFA